MANLLCKYEGRDPIFPDAERDETRRVNSIRPDLFYGQPLASAIRTYLEMRKASGMGAAAVREIFDALKGGGFKFEARDDDNAMRGLRQSLTKNSVTFHRLPNNTYGLLEWYPGVKPSRATVESETAGDDESPAVSDHSSDAPTDENDGVSAPKPKGGRNGR